MELGHCRRRRSHLWVCCLANRGARSPLQQLPAIPGGRVKHGRAAALTKFAPCDRKRAANQVRHRCVEMGNQAVPPCRESVFALSRNAFEHEPLVGGLVMGQPDRDPTQAGAGRGRNGQPIRLMWLEEMPEDLVDGVFGGIGVHVLNFRASAGNLSGSVFLARDVGVGFAAMLLLQGGRLRAVTASARSLTLRSTPLRRNR